MMMMRMVLCESLREESLVFISDSKILCFWKSVFLDCMLCFPIFEILRPRAIGAEGLRRGNC